MISRLYAQASWVLLPAVVGAGLYLSKPPVDDRFESKHAPDCHSCVVSRQQDESRSIGAAIEDDAP